MPSAQDVYITPASSVIDIYSGSTKNLYLSGSTHGYIHGASDLKITADDDISLIGGGGGSIVTFGVGAAEKMRLAETGKFGIGTTAPNQKLDVAGNINIQDGHNLRWNNATQINILGSSTTGLTYTASKQHFLTYNGSSAYVETMTLATGNTVGIGITSPDAPLQWTEMVI